MSTEQRAEDLAGISPDLAHRAGIRHVGAAEAIRLCGAEQSGLWIPYRDPAGQPIIDGGKEYGRLRLDRPDGKKKYHQAKDSEIHVYFPPGVKRVDVIVEGEKKALALAGMGMHAVGISGLYGFQTAKGSKKVLVESLEEILLTQGGDVVEFLGDGDTAHNYQFSDAVMQLLELLGPLDVRLSLPRIPLTLPKGIDDCVAQWWKDGATPSEQWVVLPRLVIDPEVFEGKMGSAELRFQILRAENEEALRVAMEGNPRIRRRVFKCVAAMGASPASQDTAAEWLREVTEIGKRAFNAELKIAKEELGDGTGMSTEAVLELVSSVVERGFTYKSNYLYPIGNDCGEYYQAFNEPEFRRHLNIMENLPKKQNRELPDASSALDYALAQLKVKPAVDYWGPVAGHQIGLHDMGGYRVLCTTGFDMVEGVEGDWGLIREYLERLLGKRADDPEWERQFRTFMGWAKAFRASLMSKETFQGQFMAWVGESGCGKTWFQEEILPLVFTGRFFQQKVENLTKSQFNKEMGEKELIIFSDATGETDWKARNTFADSVRRLVANNTQAVEGKNVNRASLKVKQRIIASLNETGIAALPILKDGVSDKLVYLRVYRVDLWDVNRRPETADYPEKLKAQLPAFVHAIDNFEVLEEEKCQRYGVVAYQHPKVSELAQTDAPWALFAELVESYLARKDGDNKIVDLRAREVFEKLSSVDMIGYLGREIKVTNIGHRLKDLRQESEKNCELFAFEISKRVVRGYNLWSILPRSQGTGL